MQCCEVIHPKARVCPHCHSPQQPRKLHAAATFLKWVGGVTAVISLVIGMDRLNDLYSSWRERAATIEELVAAARLQEEARDYAGGWSLLQQALALDPSAPAVRAYQGPFVMSWLRDLRVTEGQTFAEAVEPMLPVLYRGAASPDKALAADMLAHIGWANYLKRRGGDAAVKIDEPFERALALDPDNVYAHIHWAFWLLHNANQQDYGEANIDKARRHIEAALASGRERDYVLDLTFYGLDGSSHKGASEEMLRMAHRLSQTKELLHPTLMRSVHSMYEPIARGLAPRGQAQLSDLLEVLPPEKLLATFNWALSGMESARPPAPADLPGNRYIIGRLHEAAGNRARALAIYRELLDHPGVHESYRVNVIVPSIAQLVNDGG